jgi:hypothetical protein
MLMYISKQGWVGLAKPDSIIADLPLSGVEDGQYVSFVCKGNVGKPPGKFIWKKFRHVHFGEI